MTTTKKFARREEHFTCARCGNAVRGTGYTNHCPKCLWSKHVDENPGDRTATCGGMMEPVGIETRGKTHTISHRCVRCGTKKSNKAVADDDIVSFFLKKPAMPVS